MTKQTPHIAKFIACAQRRIEIVRDQMLRCADDPNWLALLHKNIEAGSFLKLEVGYGAAGEVAATVTLIGPKGEVVNLPAGSIAGA